MNEKKTEKDFKKALGEYYSSIVYIPINETDEFSMGYLSSCGDYEFRGTVVPCMKWYIITRQALFSLEINRPAISASRDISIFKEMLIPLEGRQEMTGIAKATGEAILIRKKKKVSFILILPEAHSALVRAAGLKEMPASAGVVKTLATVCGLILNSSCKLVVKKGPLNMMIGCVGQSYHPNPLSIFFDVMETAKTEGAHFSSGEIHTRQFLCRMEGDMTGSLIPGVEIRDSISGSGSFEVIATLRYKDSPTAIYLLEKKYQNGVAALPDLRKAVISMIENAEASARSCSLENKADTKCLKKAFREADTVKWLGKEASGALKASLQRAASLIPIFEEASHPVKTLDTATYRKLCLGSLFSKLQ